MKWLEQEPEKRALLVDLDRAMVLQSEKEFEQLKKQQKQNIGVHDAENILSERKA